MGIAGELRRAQPRIESVDALRGAVMVIMALDHVRDFLHHAAMTQQPTDLATTTPLLFLTRWITHVCAPVFMFTAGTAAYLWWQRGHSRGALSRFLATRGLWLVLLELTVMRIAYDFAIGMQDPLLLLLLVLWGLGISMLVLAALVWLPEAMLAVLAIATIALHNLLDPLHASQFGAHAPWWNLLHEAGAMNLGGAIVVVGYPLVPWVAVMALGFCAGRLYAQPAAVRQRALVGGGIALVLAFVVLRALDSYGDPVPWAAQADATFTLLSFLNTTKYPPSLQFLCMTLGPSLLALGLLDRYGLRASHPLVVLGRAPLFYFVAHFFLAHALVVALAFARYGSAAAGFIFSSVPSMGGNRALYPADFGYDLWVAYVAWIGIVLALYPACRWWTARKAASRAWWWRYL